MTPPTPATHTFVRIAFAALLTVSLVPLAHGYATRGDDYGNRYVEGEQAVEPRENTTVVTTSRRGGNFIVAFAPNGSVSYYNDTLDKYYDVDPGPGSEDTVLYVGTVHMDDVTACRSDDGCDRNVVERVNLTTGETERIYSRITPRNRDRWHDVDRLDEHRLLVADIANDRVFVLNRTTGIVEWGWDAQHDFSIRGGGWYPRDWTHVNDVEQLDDGRVMVSLRNQDQVVFLHPEDGLQSDWTLGAEGDHDTLYEQHNPDYIPADRGGPAVLVSDSENGRVVEYQREGGEWNRTWVWSDSRMQWPRDADRLPNGHTLVTDSNGGRVMEIDREGDVVWTEQVAGAYDAERVETGDESAGGQSATELGLESRTEHDGSGRTLGLLRRVLFAIEDVVPSLFVNATLYVLPGWVGYVEWIGAMVFVALAAVWGLIELWWSPWSLRWPVVWRG